MALYLDHFGLSEAPFRITPHTDFFFEGAERGTMLEALTYALLHEEGIVKVSGEVGSGKTMLCRMLMERLPEHVETIYLATPSLAADEILHAIADDLDLVLPERRTAALRKLQEHLIRLYAAGRRVVILIDEAHVMPEDTLEQVRLLSNLESNRHKLLQIVLFGQPELDETLAKSTLRQLRDRITHAFRMRPLAAAEVAGYLSFRMRAAGYRGPGIFSPRAAKRIARASAGLTRRINILADKALLAAYTQNTHAITDRHAKVAIADSEFASVGRRRSRLGSYLGGALLVGLLLGAGLAWWYTERWKSDSAAIPEAQAEVANLPRLEDEATVTDEDLVALALEEEPLAPPPSQLSAAQLDRFDGYGSQGQPLLAERLAATRELLGRAPGDHCAIQLFTTENSDPARIERFLLRARDMVPLSGVHVIPVALGSGRYRLHVLYGDFASGTEASHAASSLPPKYQREFHLTWLSFEEIRGQM